MGVDGPVSYLQYVRQEYNCRPSDSRLAKVEVTRSLYMTRQATLSVNSANSATYIQSIPSKIT